MEFGVKIEGDKELASKLDALEKKVSKGIVRSSVREAQSKLLLPAAKAAVISKVGGNMGRMIAEALKVRAAIKQKKGAYTVWVWIKPGIHEEEFIVYSRAGKRNYVPAAIEYGHVMPWGGYIGPISWMRAAAIATEQKRANRVKQNVIKGIEKAK